MATDAMNVGSRNNSSVSGYNSEIVEEVESGGAPSPRLRDDVVFVALGKDKKESESVLICALKLHEKTKKKICVLHVHQPPDRIPMALGARFSKIAGEDQRRAYHEVERRNMFKILDEYVQISEISGVKVDTLWKENASIEDGIVDLISENGIKWLIMGGAPSKYNPRRVKDLKSRKAKFVKQKASDFCHIWFVCQGSIIHTRPASRSASSTGSQHSQGSPNNSVMPLIPSSPSTPLWMPLLTSDIGNGEVGISQYCHHRVPFEYFDALTSSPSNNNRGVLSPLNPSIPEQGSYFRRSQASLSVVTHLSNNSPAPMIENHITSLPPITENGPELRMFGLNDRGSSPAVPNALEARMNELCIIDQQPMDEVGTPSKEASPESIKHKKTVNDVRDAVRMAKEARNMYYEELKCRKDTEEALRRNKEVAENARLLLEEAMEKLKHAQELKFSTERQIVESDRVVDDLEHKMYSAIDLLQKYKQERDELQLEHDKVLKECEELKNQSQASSEFFLRVTVQEIEEATNNFHPSCKIGGGGYGSVYRGKLRHTQVAIKMLKPDSSQASLAFQQEVNALNKLRHPNIVTLIGACPEMWALVYEYVPNGSLEDHLKRNGNTPPLSWKTRIRISMELCSALIFLHSCRPNGVVHGDLKPSNIFLDANYVSKLGDFGISHELPQDKSSEEETTRLVRPDKPEGTWGYVDPVLAHRGELTSLSDVYAFGVILLRLLTGKPAPGIIYEVETSLKYNKLKDILDPSAGDWPFVQAEQLAHLAIRCSHSNRRDRPNLISDVSRVLESMNLSCRILSSHFGSKDYDQIPSYFVCPIFQEVMQDPVVAADGFTYESEALKGWLDSGHDTSPMTNLRLPHFDMVPNHSLRSAIQEWLQRTRVSW